MSAIFFINGVILASWVPHIPADTPRLDIDDASRLLRGARPLRDEIREVDDRAHLP